MTGYPIGTIALVIVAALIYFGLGQRALDRLYLTDKAALALIVAMILGGYIDIPIPFAGVDASVNVGGAVIPVALAVYVLTKAGTAKEWIRALLAAAVTAVVVFSVNRYVLDAKPWQTNTDLIDPIYLYPILAGLTAYVAGRSRRAAFIAATLGVLALDIVNYLTALFTGVRTTIAIGGAGIFDVIVLSGILAVGFAEIIGESRERLQGGPATRGRDEHLLAGLKNENYGRDREKDISIVNNPDRGDDDER
ncbi:MAG: DUF1614 domain-containing protein [Bacillota bacterium]